MTQTERIRDMNRRKPHYSCYRIADELGIDRAVASVTASRLGLKFMSRKDLEDMIDGQKK